MSHIERDRGVNEECFEIVELAGHLSTSSCGFQTALSQDGSQNAEKAYGASLKAMFLGFAR